MFVFTVFNKILLKPLKRGYQSPAAYLEIICDLKCLRNNLGS